MNKSESYERLAKLEQKQKDIKEKVQDLTREHRTAEQTLRRMSPQVIKLRPMRRSERIKFAAAPTKSEVARKKNDDDDDDDGVVVGPNQLAELKRNLEEQAEALSRELKDVEHALKTVSLQVITLTNELAPILPKSSEPSSLSSLKTATS
jgi:hypothetical protein